MTAINALLAEVGELVASENGEVVAEAFMSANVRCDKCNYPENHDEFTTRHRAYAEARVEHQRLKRSREIWEMEHRHWTIMRNRVDPNDLATRYWSVRRLRRYLKQIWPCVDCIKRFNPTGRIAHPDTSTPDRRLFND